MPIGRILGLLYGLVLTLLLMVGFFSPAVRQGRGELFLVATLVNFLAFGFLLARYFHHDSRVFRAFMTVTKAQASSFEPEDQCLANFLFLLLFGLAALVWLFL